VTVNTTARTGSVLLRAVRPVPVGVPGRSAEPVDLRIVDGLVTEIAPRLPAGRGERVLEGGGRWAIPGLWDTHVHLTQWARMARRLDLSAADSPDDVIRTVAAHIASLPAGDRARPVEGYGYRSATWPSAPSVAALDAVSGEHPVVLVSGDAHNGWLNSAALRAVGVAPRDEPLQESEWFSIIGRLKDLPGDPASTASDHRAAVAAAAALGVVGVIDLEFGTAYLDWPDHFARGSDLLQVRAAVYPDHLEDVIGAGLRSGQPLPGGDGLLTMGPLKIISDGSLNTRTAFCFEPYANSGTLRDARGVQNYRPDELTGLLSRAHESGLEVAVHAIGDAAASIALDAFAATGARGSIEHAQLMTHADVARLGRLGLRASVQPAHLLDDRDVTAHCWPDRVDRCFPLRSLLDAGAILALGSDAPVAPLDPWLAMAAAVHRSNDAREPWNPAEALTPAQALAGSTDGQRTLAVGSRGDVVLLDADPLAPAADSAEAAGRLRSMPVSATLVAGRITHDQL
jgi:predicted amidohydrolase YtcJ